MIEKLLSYQGLMGVEILEQRESGVNVIVKFHLEAFVDSNQGLREIPSSGEVTQEAGNSSRSCKQYHWVGENTNLASIKEGGTVQQDFS